jgi:hypothetical protein
MVLNLPNWLPFCNSASNRFVRLRCKTGRSKRKGIQHGSRYVVYLRIPNGEEAYAPLVKWSKKALPSIRAASARSRLVRIEGTIGDVAEQVELNCVRLFSDFR